MFGVDERRHPTQFLRLRNHLQRQRRLTRRLGPEDLDHPAAWHAADAEGIVEADGAGRYGGNRVARVLLAEAHDRPLAKLLLDLADGHLDGLAALTVVPVFNWRHNAPRQNSFVVLVDVPIPSCGTAVTGEVTVRRAGDGSGCILDLCRGESQAKICKHGRSTFLNINSLQPAWTFASKFAAWQFLPAGSMTEYVQTAMMPWAAAGEWRASRCGRYGAATATLMKFP